MILYLQKNYDGTFSVAEELKGITRDIIGSDFAELLRFGKDTPLACVYERVQTLYGCKKLILDI